MRILIHSPSFHPNVGGVETISEILGRELALRGHEVRIYTESAREPGVENFPFTVVRRASGDHLLPEVRQCEAYLQMGLSLKGLYPLIFFRRPWIVSHHTWYQPSSSLLNRLKRFLMRFGTNLYCSNAIAAELQRPGIVVGNAYDDTTFRPIPGVSRNGDLVFLGRLVSDKGVDILLHALAILGTQGIAPNLTIIGSGPEQENLALLVSDLGLKERVKFVGPLRGSELAEALNRHRIMVIPSRWNEPFGIVALEGIACGCVPVGSSGGGLSEAIGPCGPLFENANPSALAERLRRTLLEPPTLDSYRSTFAAHLAQYTPQALSLRYESAILSATKPSPSRNPR